MSYAMKKDEKIKIYNDACEDMLSRIRAFIDSESKFIVGIDCDMLITRLCNKLIDIEKELIK